MHSQNSPRALPVALETMEPRLLLTAVTAAWADDFVDSVGICCHSNFWDTKYNPWSNANTIIEDIGFRHLRGVDGMHLDAMAPGYKVIAGIDAFNSSGVLDPSAASVANGIAKLKSQYPREVVVAIEGPNEYDSSTDPNRAASLRAYCDEVMRQIRQDPWFDGIPFIGPSMNYTKSFYGAVGNVAEDLDAANLHVYSYWSSWRNNEWGLNREMNSYRWMTDVKPAWCTEDGFPSGTVTPEGQGRYWPRMYLVNYNNGVERTYGYELIESASSTWGVVNLDYTYKPAATALKNMIALLEDPAASPFAAGSLDFDLTGGASDLRFSLFQKANGKFYLGLWREVANNTATTYAASNVTVQFNDGVSSVKSYTPNDGTAATTLTISNNAVSLGVTDKVVFLEITLSSTPTKPSAPGTVSATVTSGVSANVSWSNVSAEDGYVIERRDTANGWLKIASVGADVTSFIDNALSPGGSYAYRVTAVNPGGGSVSAVVSVTTPASTVFVDHLADFSHTTGGTGWTLRTEEWWTNLRDTTWANRVSDATQSLVWHYSNLENFFANCGLDESPYASNDQIKFYSSPDGVTWTQVTTEVLRAPSQGDGWTLANYRPLNGLPAGTNYIKIEMSGVQMSALLYDMKLVYGNGIGTYSSPNVAPVATQDDVFAPKGTAATFNVLANDRDANAGDILSLSAVGTPAHGTASIQNGKIVYTPSAGYSGLDQFTYTLSDGRGGTSTGTVKVTVPSVFFDGFEDGNATGWNFPAGNWSVSYDKRLRQSNLESYGWRTAIWGDSAASTWTNYAVEADINAYGTVNNSKIGLLFCYQDANNCYRFVLNDWDSKAVLEKVSGGTVTTLATQIAPAYVRYGDYFKQHLRVEVKDGVIHCYRNGVDVFGAINDTTFSAGTVGLATGNHFTYFDNVAVFSLDPAPTTMPSETFNAGSAVTDQTTLESVFNVNVVSTNKWTYSSTGGVDNTGRLQTPGGQVTYAIHKTGMAGFGTYSGVTLSADTYINSSGVSTNSLPFYGIVRTDTTAAAGGLYFRMQWNTSTQVYDLYGQGTLLGSVTRTQLGQTSKWFNWQANWVKDASNQFDLTLSLYDIGVSGVSTPTLVSSWTLNNIVDSTVLSAESLYMGVGGKARDNTGVYRVDNLALTGQVANLPSETFDAGSAVTDQTTLESVFTVNTVSTNKWTYSSTGGVNNTGRLQTPGGQVTYAMHNTGLPGFGTVGSLTLSMDTYINSSGVSTNSLPFYGIVKTDTTASAAGLYFRMQWNTSTQVYDLYGQGTLLGSVTRTQLGQTGKWFHWDATWVKDASNQFDLTLSLYDIGVSGVSTPTLVSSWTLNNIVDSTVLSADTLYMGIGGKARDNTGVYRVDNLEATAG